MALTPTFWRGRKVLLTGHTGFKGAWLSLWLQKLGAEVTGYALKPPTNPSLFQIADAAMGMRSIEGDIRDLPAFTRILAKAEPDIVIHMAAQSLVRASYADPVSTYETNVMGTVHVLEAARSAKSVRVLLNVTSDKCYENRERASGYREDEPMGGADPYSNSKGCSELVTAAYRRSFFSQPGSAAVASARAGNVIGGGDWAQDRLIPDFVRSVQAGMELSIRSPDSIRPWQFVLEPLHGYLLLCEALASRPGEFAEGWNFGPASQDEWPVRRVIERLATHWGEGARWAIDKGPHPHEAGYLKLDASKARARLGWQPRLRLDEALASIAQWSRAYLNGADMRELTLGHIQSYEARLLS
jgi:CDP-glucose 4,6-dehydratase